MRLLALLISVLVFLFVIWPGWLWGRPLWEAVGAAPGPTPVAAQTPYTATAVTQPTVVPQATVQPTPRPTLAAKPQVTPVAQATPVSGATPFPAAAATQQPSDGSYALPPQPQIGHPSLYLETGVPDPVGRPVSANTKRWQLEILPGTVAIIGGFVVDGVSGGVYKAVGPGQLDTTVTDGFLAIVKAEWARAEFCFRVGQARQFGWAHNTVRPLSGWAQC